MVDLGAPVIIQHVWFLQELLLKTINNCSNYSQVRTCQQEIFPPQTTDGANIGREGLGQFLDADLLLNNKSSWISTYNLAK